MTTSLTIARLIAGSLPSALLVVAVFLISLLALMLGPDRRNYALQVVDRMLDLAGVLVGVEPNKPELAGGRHL